MAIQFGRYQLLKKLAAGGMGQVFLARTGEEGFEKLVVLKSILPHLVEDQEFYEMFRDEAKVSMRLNHPNIVQIFEFGQERGIHFLVMEYVAGEDVRKMVKRIGQQGQTLPLGAILRIIADATAGLDYAHKATDSKGQPLGIIHRDVSPQNVLVGFDGAVKLIDFGVAKAAGRAQHTATGILKGKFPYMSPEQAEGDELDPRSDLFAIGIVLWELLTGRRLFKGESDTATQKLVRTCNVPAPSTLGAGLPQDLDAIVLKSLAKNREERFPDAGAMRMAIEEFITKKGIAASPAHLVSFLRPFYIERIAQEQSPDSLDELTSESQLDWSKAGTPGTGANQAHVPGRVTEAVQSQKKGGSKAWVGIGAAAVLGIGGFAVYKTMNAPPPEKTVVVPHIPVEEPPVKPPPVKPVEEAKLKFRVESDPPGAEVERNGTHVGQTPWEFETDAKQLPATLRLSRDGFEPKEMTVTASTGPLVSLQLTKKKVAGIKAPGIKTNR
ncbi:MAG: serine/threonine-protein kinase [Myxococcaceae bacterium]